MPFLGTHDTLLVQIWQLLGLNSNDIDVALSTMMGVTFAEHLIQFMSEKGHVMREATRIARNPDQSKHLETAMVNVLGLDIDLVNLRSEVYAEGSRIPSEVVRCFNPGILSSCAHWL